MTHNDKGPIHECCWTDFNQQNPSSSSSSNVGGDEGGVGSEEDDAVSDKMDWWERRHPPSTFHGMWDLTQATDWTNAYPIGNGVRQFTSNDRLHLHMHLHMHRPASTRLARDVHVLLSSVILEFLRALHESDLYIYRIYRIQTPTVHEYHCRHWAGWYQASRGNNGSRCRRRRSSTLLQTSERDGWPNRKLNTPRERRG